METGNFSWVPCDSRSDLEARLAALRGVKVLRLVETEGANTWGFLNVPSEEPLVLPVGFADVGLVPAAILVDGLLLLGITEVVVGIELSTGALAFRYRVPTVFHEFVRVDENGVLVQDEIGFVLLSLHGEELWKFSRDLIQDYKLTGNELVVTTLDGERFNVEVGGPNGA